MVGSNPNVKVVTAKRALLAEISQLNAANGYDKATQLPGFLRTEAILGIQNSVEFAIRSDESFNGQAINSTENRLQINDAFFIEHYGLAFYKFATAGGKAARARAALETFGNGFVFGLNAPEVEAAYNSRLALRVDSEVFIDSMDTARFRNVQTAQKGTAVSSVAVTGIQSASAWSQNEMFAHETDPLVRLNGPGRNQFTLTFPDNLDFTLVAGESVVAVLYLRGWLSQNGGGMRRN